MEVAMFKEALICGIGMVFDLSGSSYSHNQNATIAAAEGISSDWKHVGHLLSDSIKSERPKIEAEAAKQLHLNLG